MKLILLSRLTNLWRRKNDVQKCGIEQIHQKVIKFEDCERINRERFNTDQVIEINMRNQIFAAISVSIGTSIGWTSPSISHLKSLNASLNRPLNSQELYWLTSFLPLGALVGTYSFAFLSEKFGSYWMLWFTSIPQIISLLYIIFAKTVEHLYIARLFAGLCMGGAFVLIPVYISEISNIKIRAALNSLFYISTSLGTMLAFIIGSYARYNLVSKFNVIFPMIFAISFLLFPETPYYLLKCGRNKEAENSLKFLCGCRSSEQTPEAIMSRLIAIARKVEKNENERKNSSLRKELESRSVQNSLFIGIVLVIVNQLCGCFTFINYSSIIFMRTGTAWSPQISSIVVSIVHFTGSIVSMFVTEKLSRKLLYSLSSCLIVFGLLIFGVYGLMSEFYNLKEFDWIPVASLSLSVLAASIGILPLTFILLSELLPFKVRKLGTSFCEGSLWLTAFILIRFFPSIFEKIQLYNCMFMFSSVTFVGMIFMIAVVPETKNQSAVEIEKQLR